MWEGRKTSGAAMRKNETGASQESINTFCFFVIVKHIVLLMSHSMYSRQVKSSQDLFLKRIENDGCRPERVQS